VASDLGRYRSGMGDAWYAEQLARSSCNPDGSAR
jgi:hypothetical protein